jgi:hypothetical protein
MSSATVCSNAVGIMTGAAVFPNLARKSHFVSAVVQKSRSLEDRCTSVKSQNKILLLSTRCLGVSDGRRGEVYGFYLRMSP